MNLLAAMKREERKLEKQLGKLQHQLNGVRAAAKALGRSIVSAKPTIPIVVSPPPVEVIEGGYKSNSWSNGRHRWRCQYA